MSPMLRTLTLSAKLVQGQAGARLGVVTLGTRGRSLQQMYAYTSGRGLWPWLAPVIALFGIIFILACCVCCRRRQRRFPSSSSPPVNLTYGDNNSAAHPGQRFASFGMTMATVGTAGAAPDLRNQCESRPSQVVDGYPLPADPDCEMGHVAVGVPVSSAVLPVAGAPPLDQQVQQPALQLALWRQQQQQEQQQQQQR